MLWLMVIVFSVLLDLTAAQTDPCKSYSDLNEETRSPENAFDFTSGEAAISDDRLSPGWYRIVSDTGEDMSTKPPGLYQCGTWYPIWLNGNLPKLLNSQISQPVCVQYFDSDCYKTWTIDIKRCTENFLVYNLGSSLMEKSAYCFGKPEDEVCSTSTDCRTTMTCISGICQCATAHYWNGTSCIPQKSMNESCEITEECKSNLTCISGTCLCTDEEYWMETYCIERKKKDEICTNFNQCMNSLTCISGICLCTATQYWNEPSCHMKKTVNGECSNTDGCLVNLTCTSGTCVCRDNEYWMGTDCAARQTLEEQCNTDGECLNTLTCVNETCQCLSTQYWTGSTCDARKTKDESCTNSDQCMATLTCISGSCLCTTVQYWTGSTCDSKKNIQEQCSKTEECLVKLTCISETCLCRNAEYWTGDECASRKSIKVSCNSDEECQATLVCSSGFCNCTADQFWTGTVCAPRKTIGETCTGDLECSDTLTCISGRCQCTTLQFWTGEACFKTLYPDVEAALEESQIIAKTAGSEHETSSRPVFKCNFQDLGEASVLYDIQWYIDDSLITSHLNVPFSDIQKTNLVEKDWVATHTMNMKVKCSATYKKSNKKANKHFSSSDFPAGIFPEKYEFSVFEGDRITIPLKSTVPIGCTGTTCSQDLYISMPNRGPDGCNTNNNVKYGDLMFKTEFCGIQIPGNSSWNQYRNLTVFGYVDGRYNSRHRSASIRLSKRSQGNEHNVWSKIYIPDVKITVSDRDYTVSGKQCRSSNDPHITTFDGKLYHYMEVGEFVLYRNPKGPYWVHVLLTDCGVGWTGSSCHCGIAIRSRNSIFVFRLCAKVSRNSKNTINLRTPHIELKSCDENDMTIFQSNGYYRVTLPSGTEIRFNVWRTLVSSVTIKPSLTDVESTEGLCGFLSKNGNQADDFKERYSGKVASERTFADSWRIKSIMKTEQLFVKNPDCHSSGNFGQPNYCSCKEEASASDNLVQFYEQHCKLPDIAEICGKIPSSKQFVTTCVLKTRKRRSESSGHDIAKRSVSSDDDDDDIIDFAPVVFDDDVEKTVSQSSNFTGGWTEDKARKFCTKHFTEAIPLDFVESQIALDTDGYIESCIEDIKITGETIFMNDTIEAARTYILIEMSRNESFSEDAKNHVMKFMCQNNCSQHGYCVNGICNCTNGFVGTDCSKPDSTPPLDFRLPENGLCGRKSRQCQKTNIVGEFLSTFVWCKLDHFYVTATGKEYTSHNVTIAAERRNMYLASCPFPTSTRRRRSVTEDETIAEGYDISVSNDGTNFGGSETIIIYDEDCYICNASLATCTVLASCSDKSSESNGDVSQIVAGTVVTFAVILLFVAGIGYCIRKKSKVWDAMFLNCKTTKDEQTQMRQKKRRKNGTVNQMDRPDFVKRPLSVIDYS